MIKIGDKVRVNYSNKVYDDFWGAVGTVIKEFTPNTGVRKLVVQFDGPIKIWEPANNYFPEEYHFFEYYDFMEDCLDLVEE